MFGRPKYTYYSCKDTSGYRGSKKKYKMKKRKVNEYDEIKEDAYKLCYDVKRLFNKKRSNGFKIPKNNSCTSEFKTIKFLCLGIIGFILMSSVITFPAALLVCLLGALLYYYK
ncbi:MAG: hypothetical protein ACRCTZ_04035 [Sarcina sp.]